MLDEVGRARYRPGMPKRKARENVGDTDCRQRCTDQALAARALAQKDFNEMREACNRIGDTNQRAQCLINAANAFNTTVQAIQRDYELCLRTCDEGGGSSTNPI